MPLFNYRLTYATETRSTELRKSNPQGWLLQAVEATFPEIASRHADEIIRLRLEKVSGLKQTWRVTLNDGLNNLLIHVTQVSPRVRQ